MRLTLSAFVAPRAAAATAVATVLVFALLIAPPAVRADVPDMAVWFDRTNSDIETAYAKAAGQRRWALGLILADDYTSEAAPDRGIELLDDLPTPEAMTRAGANQLALYAMGIRATALMRVGKPEESVPIFAELVRRADAIEHPEIRASVYSHMMFIEMRKGQRVAAYAHARQASEAAERSSSRYLQSRAWNNEALVMHMSGMYSQSLPRFARALESARQVSFRSIDEIIQFNLGLSQLETGDYEGALQSFEVGSEWATRMGDAPRLLIADTHRAMALLALDRGAEAIEALRKSLSVQGERADMDGVANAYRLLGRAHLDLGDMELADASVVAGLAAAAKGGNTLREQQLRLLKIDVLQALGRNTEALGEARSVLSETASPSGVEHIDALRKLAELEAQAGNFEQAFTLDRRANELEAQAKGESYAQELAMLAVSNNVQRSEERRTAAERKARQLEGESRVSRILSTASLGALLLIVLVGLLGRERYVQQRLIRQERQISRDLETQVAERTNALRREMDERLAVEREGAALRDSLAAADKLGALGKLTGGVAHDFNNLLTVINGAAGILVSKPDMEAAQRRRLAEAIASAGEAGADICRGLLAYARRQPLKPEVFDVRAHIESQLSLFEQTLGDGIVLDLALSSAKVRVDPGQLTTAIINLLSNAREAMSGEGTVSIRVGIRDDDERIFIEVSDTGRGMTPDQVYRASEPFYSTKQSSLATGLGLSAVQGFMRQSGGDLQIESAVGQGTCMRLLLPPSDERQVVIPEQHEAQAPASDGRIRTLLVDDNDAVAQMLTSMLELIGHNVKVASTPQHALELVASEELDLLVSDVVMPGAMNGVELVDRALAMAPHLRVLLLSGYVHKNMLLPYPFLPKPFSQDLFSTTIEQIMRAPEQAVAAQAE